MLNGKLVLCNNLKYVICVYATPYNVCKYIVCFSKYNLYSMYLWKNFLAFTYFSYIKKKIEKILLFSLIMAQLFCPTLFYVTNDFVVLQETSFCLCTFN